MTTGRTIFTNSAASTPAERQGYIAAVVELVGARDPLDILRTTAAEVRAVLDGLDDAALVRPEAPGKWSLRHVVQHLADAELVFGWRIRLVLAHDRPRLTGFDQDVWAGRLRYEATNAHEALADFDALRAANVRLVTRVPSAELERVGMHEERGEESVAFMLRLYAGHDLAHLRQLRRIRAGHGT
jgi:hypothetical protein